LRELFIDILGVDADISSTIEKYLSQDYKFKQSLNDTIILAENKKAEIELKTLMKKTLSTKPSESKFSGVNIVNRSPKLSDFKENKYFTFYDGSLI
jgi:hypothetical protein